VFNAANEIAVAAFLDHKLPFNRITDVIEAVLERIPSGSVTQLSEVMDADLQARSAAREIIAGALVQ
jgi:1-deoxy-D-xylulose-5-phosphate reductoisomerase